MTQLEALEWLCYQVTEHGGEPDMLTLTRQRLVAHFPFIDQPPAAWRMEVACRHA